MEEKRQEEVDLIQWHPTFFADVQVELRKESEKLSFQSEYQLSKKPMEIDVLIIKKKQRNRSRKISGEFFASIISWSIRVRRIILELMISIKCMDMHAFTKRIQARKMKFLWKN